MTNKLFLSTAMVVVLGAGLTAAWAQSGASDQDRQPLPLKQQQQPSGTDEAPKSQQSGEETTKPKSQQSGEETTKPKSQQSGEETTKPKSQQSGEETTKPKSQQSGEETTKPKSQQSGEETTKPKSQQSGEETTKPKPQQSGEETTKPKSHQSGEEKTPKDDATGAISPTREQTTKVRERVDFKRYAVTNVTFNVRVGTAVPRTIVLYDPTPDLIAIMPAWRRYKLIVVSGDILLIDPDTYEIVAVIEG